MSISNDSSHVELIASSDTTVTAHADIDVIRKDDLAISGRKNEYSIIGDGIYTSVSAGPAPVWLTQIIDSVISSALGAAMSGMSNANANILQAISEIEAARNTYDAQVNIAATIDSLMISHLETLNASLGGVNDTVAEIKNLQTVFVTEDQAVALSGSVVEASLNTPGGLIHGAVGTLESVIAGLEETVATNYTEVRAQMGDLEASVTQEMVAFVTDAGNVGARFKIDLETTNLDADGNPITVIGGMNLTSDGVTTSAGFDVDSFWVGKAGVNGKHPFSIQGNDIYFNGKVNFSSVTDVPQLGSTPDEVVAAINDGTTTSINGGSITTGSLHANRIEGKSITAGQIEANSITADEIDVDSLIVKKLQANIVANPTGMVIDTINGYIKLYDTGGALRLQMGMF